MVTGKSTKEDHRCSAENHQRRDLRTGIKSRFLISIFFFLLAPFALFPQGRFPYANTWKKVDSLSGLGQPKSALEMVGKINQAAVREKNDPQILKSVIYTIRLNADFRENFYSWCVGYLQSEIKTAREPGRQLLFSILAEVYWKYNQNNQYRFQDRTTSAVFKADSLETWDLQTIMDAVISAYRQSLGHEALLKSIPIKQYDAILESAVFDKKRVPVATGLRPTLYDFLAHRALDFFTNSEGQKIQPAAAFQIDNPDFFEQADRFAQMPLHSEDSLSVRLLALRIYQELDAFHLKDKDPAALIDLELERFGYLRIHALVADKDSLYRSSLETLEAKYSASPASTGILYLLASFLNDQGGRYIPLVSEKYRFDLKQALEICRKAIRAFPESSGALKCKNLAAQIEQPSVEVTKEYAVPAEKPSLALLRFRNVTQLYFRVCPVDPEAYGQWKNQAKREEYLKYFASLPLQDSWSVQLPATGDFQLHAAEIRVPAVPVGFYVLVCGVDSLFRDPSNLFTNLSFWSTGLSYVSLRTDSGGFDYYLLDRESGNPVKGAGIEAWTRDYNYATRDYQLRQIGSFTSDKNGFFSLPPVEAGARYSNIFLKIRHDRDFFISENFYQYPESKPAILPRPVTWFFTDRAIYRPGQTIWYKGVSLMKNGDSYKIMTNTQTRVVFTDANGQKLSEQNLVTNDFGSFNGSVVIPAGLLPGEMTLSNGTGSIQVSVEEYRRPTFEVTFNPVEGNYRLGDVVKTSGKAIGYAGNTLDGATVRYRVVRTARFPFWGRPWYCPVPQSPETEIVNGTLKTGSDGQFEISFPAVPDYLVDKSDNPVFDYRVYADVTDLNGETQGAEGEVSVGYLSLFVNLDLPEKLNLRQDSLLKLTTTNLGGRKTAAKVTVALRKLRQPERILKSRMWDRPDLCLTGKEEFYSWFPNDLYNNEDDPALWEQEEPLFNRSFDTQSDSVLNLKTLTGGAMTPGYYLLSARSVDPYGQPVERTFYSIVFDPLSSALPVTGLDWFVPVKTSGNPGESAEFLIGSEEQQVHVLCEVRKQDSILSREWIELNQSQRLITVPIQESCRGNFFVNFLFARHNRTFQNSQLISVPYSDKKLDITFESFRDKVEPGSGEEWKIRIATAGKKAADAELAISMYDASLDVFRPNSWSFGIYPHYFYFNSWNIRDAFKTATGSWSLPVKSTGNIPELNYPALNWFGLYYFSDNGYRNRRMGKGMALTSEAIAAPVSGMDGQVPPPADEQPQVSRPESDQESTDSKAGTPGSSGIQVRRDFRETAFFYPSLTTDSTGSLVVKFTTPESLTRWKVLGLAYTKNLDYGLFTKELVTRKDLMVFPNAPRFLRHGDTLLFSTKISNLSGRHLSGTVSITLLDGLTQHPLDSLVSGDRTLPFETDPDGSVSVAWTLRIPTDPGLSVLKYRIVARAGSFSDGEEKAIPVLPNRMLVTESMPLPVRGKGSFRFTFDKLLRSGASATANNYRVTLEFAANPAWYAVQAIPALGQRKYDHADAVFASYYANELASFLMRSNPSIRDVFESWKNSAPDALLSNLEKNQQLKSALLQETPWVTEAKNETENKQRLGQYFDPAAIQSSLSADLRKLKEIQSPQGGWPWFDGMVPGRYLSQNILTGFGRLYHLGVRDYRKEQDLWSMISRTIDYLDKELADDYTDLKKLNGVKMEEDHLGALQIQYLYARSCFITEKPVAPRTREAFDYYVSQAKKYWPRHDGYLQGMIALSLNRFRVHEIPLLIIRSLSEKALHSKEMGMYWSRPAGWYWYEAPVESQALLIEAFDEIAADSSSVEEMKVWLLKQKQTQMWETSRATLDAIYALLLRGADLLADNPGLTIQAGGELIDPARLTDTKKEAGSGYFQQSWYGKEITPAMGNITVNNPSGGIAWGSVYWQYFENLDRITPASTPMRVEKRLFVVQNTPSGPVQLPVSENTPLKTGDRLNVRIVLTVDRDMEFVHMKDQRAAAFEPVAARSGPGSRDSGSLSGYRYQDGLGYYQTMTDQAVNFFFDNLPKGTYVFEYPLVAGPAGDYSNGITTVQCMYAPEFSAHSEGIRVQVK